MNLYKLNYGCVRFSSSIVNVPYVIILSMSICISSLLVWISINTFKTYKIYIKYFVWCPYYSHNEMRWCCSTLGKSDNYMVFIGLLADWNSRSYKNIDGSIPKQVGNIYIWPSIPRTQMIPLAETDIPQQTVQIAILLNRLHQSIFLLHCFPHHVLAIMSTNAMIYVYKSMMCRIVCFKYNCG